MNGLSHLESAAHRQAAYLEALSQAGIGVDTALIQPGNFTRAAGAAALRYFATLPEPPTAIFACNDDTAFGILEEASTLGIDVPRALSVVGYDNVPESAFTRPALTTVDQDLKQLVRTAMHMLFELIARRPLSQEQVKLPNRLVVRNSCAPPVDDSLRRWPAHKVPLPAKTAQKGGETLPA